VRIRTRGRYFVADAGGNVVRRFRGFAFWHRGRSSSSVFALALTYTTMR
jgi:hypothetical protein